MNSIFLLLLAVHNQGCPAPKVLDWTDSPWTQQDTTAYSGAVDRCKAHFGDQAPCLKKFIKKGIHTYYAICGLPINKSSSNSLERHYWFTISDTQDAGQQNSFSGGSTASEQRCSHTCSRGRAVEGGRK